MGKITEYRNRFEKIKKMKDLDERKSGLEKLLEEYRSNKDVRILAIKSSDKELEKIEDLEFKIYAEKEEPGITECKKRDREILIKYIGLINQNYNKSPFKSISLERARRRNMLTPEELMRPFTI